MDLQAFPSFKPFLEITDQHASLAGYRFRGLQDFPTDLHPYITSFAKELKNAAKSDELREELDRAILLCESEAIRKVMVVTCKEIDVWPPDFENEDQRDIAGIAFALWNQQRSLDEDPVMNQQHKRLNMTAFFIVDFAFFAGIPEAGETSTAGKRTLNDFLLRAKRQQPNLKDKMKKAVLGVLEEFFPESTKLEFKAWFDSQWDYIALSAAFAAGIAIASWLFSNTRRK